MKIFSSGTRSGSASCALFNTAYTRSSSMVADDRMAEVLGRSKKNSRGNERHGAAVKQEQQHQGGGGRRRRGEDEEAGERRREIEVRVISAQDLKRSCCRLGSLIAGRRKMRTYAVAYVDPEHKARTRTDDKGGQSDPVWNQVLTVSVPESALRHDSLSCLTIDIFSEAAASPSSSTFWLSDRLVGTARIFLSDFVKLDKELDACDAHAVHNVNPIRCMAFWVRLPSGDPHGILNVWIPPTGRFLPRPVHPPPPSDRCHKTNSSSIYDVDDLSSSLPAKLHPDGKPCSNRLPVHRPTDIAVSIIGHHHKNPNKHHCHHLQLLHTCSEAETERFTFD